MLDEIHHTVPEGLCMAFYKGIRPGIHGIANRIGRYLDNGPYSHTELIFSDVRYSASSSIMDGGVRIKFIGYTSVGSWDFLPIPDTDGKIEKKVKDWFQEYAGAKYDIMGNIRFATNFARDNPHKWFCSEANLAALEIPEPYRYGPSGAATFLSWYFNSEMVYI